MCHLTEHPEAEVVLCVRNSSEYLPNKVVFSKKCKEQEVGYNQNKLTVSNRRLLRHPVMDPRLQVVEDIEWHRYN